MATVFSIALSELRSTLRAISAVADPEALKARIAELSEHGFTMTEQEINVLESYMNSDAFAKSKEIYNQLQEGDIGEAEAREEIIKQRLNQKNEEDDELESDEQQ